MTDPTLARIEARRLVAQDRLDRARSGGERNRLGQFATPPELARSILALADRSRLEVGATGPARFLDPAVGSGSFFGAALGQWGRGGIARAVGVEVDPAVASVARSTWTGQGLDVVDGDFTAIEPPAGAAGRFDVIVANPPYVRHHHLDPARKPELAARVRDRLGLAVGGLAGLYAYFLLLADAWLAEGGVAVWLIPAEFLDVNYGGVIRDYLSTRVTLLRVHRFRPEDGQFPGALVTSAVVAFAKRPPPAGHRARWTLGGPLDRPERTAEVSVATLAEARKWSRCSDERAGATDPAAPTLGDLFAIRRGVATGANGFFIMTRTEARDRGIPADLARPILPSPRYVRSGVIEADGDGFPLLDRVLVLLDCRLPEIELARSAPGLARYLAEGRTRGVAATYLTTRRTPWYKQERRDPAPFLCSYMGRAGPARAAPLRFFWNRSAAIAPNVYLMLYPRDALRDRLQARPELHAAVFDRLRAIEGAALLAEGRVYGGGLHKVEPRELAGFPLGASWDDL